MNNHIKFPKDFIITSKAKSDYESSAEQYVFYMGANFMKSEVLRLNETKDVKTKEEIKSAEEILKENKLSPEDMSHYKIWDYVISAMEEYSQQFHPPAYSKEERFKMPSDKKLVEIAILFNDGHLDEEQLSKMVGMCNFVLDRLQENNDVSIPSKNETEA